MQVVRSAPWNNPVPGILAETKRTHGSGLRGTHGLHRARSRSLVLLSRSPRPHPSCCSRSPPGLGRICAYVMFRTRFSLNPPPAPPRAGALMDMDLIATEGTYLSFSTTQTPETLNIYRTQESIKYIIQLNGLSDKDGHTLDC